MSNVNIPRSGTPDSSQSSSSRGRPTPVRDYRWRYPPPSSIFKKRFAFLTVCLLERKDDVMTNRMEKKITFKFEFLIELRQLALPDKRQKPA